MARHIARGDTEETATERQVREAIQRHLGEDDVVISGLRLHDNTYGDVEIDLIVLMPNAGVGIVEVKGGTITYAEGTWHQSGKEGTKEIDPAGQARRGWHAFRRFVERQPAWSRGRLRGDWFLAFPQTHVPPDEDMGPEGRRETIIAEGEELQEPAYKAAAGVDLKDVRPWATANGAPVPDRGRIAGEVIQQYKAAIGL